MAGGFANREIPHALHLAEGTVKNHVSSILLSSAPATAPAPSCVALELGPFRRGAE